MTEIVQNTPISKKLSVPQTSNVLLIYFLCCDNYSAKRSAFKFSEKCSVYFEVAFHHFFQEKLLYHKPPHFNDFTLIRYEILHNNIGLNLGFISLLFPPPPFILIVYA